jgi:hypothetical protein
MLFLICGDDVTTDSTVMCNFSQLKMNGWGFGLNTSWEICGLPA